METSSQGRGGGATQIVEAVGCFGEVDQQPPPGCFFEIRFQKPLLFVSFFGRCWVVAIEDSMTSCSALFHVDEYST